MTLVHRAAPGDHGLVAPTRDRWSPEQRSIFATALTQARPLAAAPSLHQELAVRSTGQIVFQRYISLAETFSGRNLIIRALTGSAFGALDAAQASAVVRFLDALAAGTIKPPSYNAAQNGLAVDVQNGSADLGPDILARGIVGAYVGSLDEALISVSGLDAAGQVVDETAFMGAVVEETGEAVAQRASDFGVRIGDGDVGERLRLALSGLDTSVQARPDLNKARASDTTVVHVGHQRLAAKAMNVNPDADDPSLTLTEAVLDKILTGAEGGVSFQAAALAKAEALLANLGVTMGTDALLSFAGQQSRYEEFFESAIEAQIRNNFIVENGAIVFNPNFPRPDSAISAGTLAIALKAFTYKAAAEQSYPFMGAAAKDSFERRYFSALTALLPPEDFVTFRAEFCVAQLTQTILGRNPNTIASETGGLALKLLAFASTRRTGNSDLAGDVSALSSAKWATLWGLVLSTSLSGQGPRDPAFFAQIADQQILTVVSLLDRRGVWGQIAPLANIVASALSSGFDAATLQRLADGNVVDAIDLFETARLALNFAELYDAGDFVVLPGVNAVSFSAFGMQGTLLALIDSSTPYATSRTALADKDRFALIVEDRVNASLGVLSSSAADGARARFFSIAAASWMNSIAPNAATSPILAQIASIDNTTDTNGIYTLSLEADRAIVCLQGLVYGAAVSATPSSATLALLANSLGGNGSNLTQRVASALGVAGPSTSFDPSFGIENSSLSMDLSLLTTDLGGGQSIRSLVLDHILDLFSELEWPSTLAFNSTITRYRNRELTKAEMRRQLWEHLENIDVWHLIEYYRSTFFIQIATFQSRVVVNGNQIVLSQSLPNGSDGLQDAYPAEMAAAAKKTAVNAYLAAIRADPATRETTALVFLAPLAYLLTKAEFEMLTAQLCVVVPDELTLSWYVGLEENLEAIDVADVDEVKYFGAAIMPGEELSLFDQAWSELYSDYSGRDSDTKERKYHDLMEAKSFAESGFAGLETNNYDADITGAEVQAHIIDVNLVDRLLSELDNDVAFQESLRRDFHAKLADIVQDRFVLVDGKIMTRPRYERDYPIQLDDYGDPIWRAEPPHPEFGQVVAAMQKAAVDHYMTQTLANPAQENTLLNTYIAPLANAMSSDEYVSFLVAVQAALDVKKLETSQDGAPVTPGAPVTEVTDKDIDAVITACIILQGIKGFINTLGNSFQMSRMQWGLFAKAIKTRDPLHYAELRASFPATKPFLKQLDAYSKSGAFGTIAFVMGIVANGKLYSDSGQFAEKLRESKQEQAVLAYNVAQTLSYTFNAYKEAISGVALLSRALPERFRGGIERIQREAVRVSDVTRWGNPFRTRPGVAVEVLVEILAGQDLSKFEAVRNAIGVSDVQSDEGRALKASLQQRYGVDYDRLAHQIVEHYQAYQDKNDDFREFRRKFDPIGELDGEDAVRNWKSEDQSKLKDYRLRGFILETFQPESAKPVLYEKIRRAIDILRDPEIQEPFGLKRAEMTGPLTEAQINRLASQLELNAEETKELQAIRDRNGGVLPQGDGSTPNAPRWYDKYTRPRPKVTRQETIRVAPRSTPPAPPTASPPEQGTGASADASTERTLQQWLDGFDQRFSSKFGTQAVKAVRPQYGVMARIGMAFKALGIVGDIASGIAGIVMGAFTIGADATGWQRTANKVSGAFSIMSGVAGLAGGLSALIAPLLALPFLVVSGVLGFLAFLIPMFMAWAQKKSPIEEFRGKMMERAGAGSGSSPYVRAGAGDWIENWWRAHSDHELAFGEQAATSHTLQGGSGNETFVGSALPDRLIGGAGADDMSGGLGSDTYVVDDPHDVVREEGPSWDDIDVDTVEVIATSFVLPYLVENGVAVGAGASTIIGNYLQNTITGGAGADMLSGGLGDDLLVGGNGADTLWGGLQDDDLQGGEGADMLAGGGWADKLDGGAGADTLDGGSGADTMTGGAGADIFIIDQLEDRITDASAEDTVVVQVANYDTALLGAARVRLEVLRGAGYSLAGGRPNETLSGSAGSDTLSAAGGAMTLNGGRGDDVYTVDDASDRITELTDGGRDRVLLTASTYTLPGQVEDISLVRNTPTTVGTQYGQTVAGNAGDNSMVANTVMRDLMIGGDGADTLQGYLSDTLNGGAGNDVYIVKDYSWEIQDSSGADTLIGNGYGWLPGAIEALLLTGANAAGYGNANANLIVVEAVNSRVSGAEGADTILGGRGADTLDGGTGADLMRGGAGADVFIVDDLGDRIVDATSEDRVIIRVAGYNTAYLRGVTLENQVAQLASSNTVLGGTSSADTIFGGAGAETLDGSAGNDRLEGGSGDDVYLVGNAGVTVVEPETFPEVIVGWTVNRSGGTDTIVTPLTSYSLAATPGVENLVFTGGGGATGSGNAADNALTGGAGADSLYGGAGHDRLDGGAGADTLAGGSGNDVYVVDNSADKLIEAADQGFDTVEVNTSVYSLPDHIETASMGVAGSLSGNASANSISGSAAADSINAGAGNDTVTSLGGADKLWGGDGNDLLNAGAGNDTLDGGAWTSDTAVFSGPRSAYVVTWDSATGVCTVSDTRPGSPDGVDQLSNVEFLQFSNLRARADNTPPYGLTFEDFYYGRTVGSATPNDTAVGIIRFQDPDLRDPHTFMITNWPSYFPFAVNEVGRIYVSHSEYLKEAADYEFTVRVTDSSGAWGELRVKIAVGDLTVQSGDYVYVQENAEAGTFVATIESTYFHPGPRFYRQFYTNDSRFKLTQHGYGTYENITHFTLSVSDYANIDFESEKYIDVICSFYDWTNFDTLNVNVRIFVSNVFEPEDISIQPQFNFGPQGSIVLPELSAGGTALGVVSFSAPDPNLPFQYYLEYNSDFVIDTVTGLISVAQGCQIQRDYQRFFTIVVVQNGNRYEREFVVTSSNVAEAPVDISLSNNILPEGSAPGTVIGTLSGLDPDPNSVFTYALVDNAAGRFSVNATTGVISVAAGALLDCEAQPRFTIRVRVTDETGFSFTKDFDILLSDVNEAPVLALSQTSLSLPEAPISVGGVKVADIIVTDDARGDNAIIRSGPDAAYFDVRGTELWFIGALDFEAKASYAVSLTVTDSSLTVIGSTATANPAPSVNFTLTITDVNEAPTAITLSRASISLAQNTVIPATGYKVADIVIADDAMGSETITLDGPDKTSFQVRGTELFYIGGVFSYATKASYSVTIKVDDPTIGASPDASLAFTLKVADPTYALSSLKTTIAESSPAGTRVKIGEVTGVSISATTNGLRVAGEHASKFYFMGRTLYYNGSAIEYAEMAASGYKFNYRVEYFTRSTDTIIWCVDQTLAINKSPTISLSRPSASIAEDASIPTGGQELATISILDDAVGTETVTVSDKTNFKVENGRLYFIGKLNYEKTQQYTVSVRVDDPTIGSTYEAQVAFVLTVTDVNEAPTLSLSRSWINVPENTIVPAGGLKVANITINDDALGAETLGLSGPDKALFKIEADGLYFIGQWSDLGPHGTSYDTLPVYSVTVEVNDSTVGGPVDASKTFKFSVDNGGRAGAMHIARTSIERLFHTSNTWLLRDALTPPQSGVAPANVQSLYDLLASYWFLNWPWAYWAEPGSMPADVAYSYEPGSSDPRIALNPLAFPVSSTTSPQLQKAVQQAFGQFVEYQATQLGISIAPGDVAERLRLAIVAGNAAIDNPSLPPPVAPTPLTAPELYTSDYARSYALQEVKARYTAALQSAEKWVLGVALNPSLTTASSLQPLLNLLPSGSLWPTVQIAAANVLGAHEAYRYTATTGVLLINPGALVVGNPLYVANGFGTAMLAGVGEALAAAAAKAGISVTTSGVGARLVEALRILERPRTTTTRSLAENTTIPATTGVKVADLTIATGQTATLGGPDAALFQVRGTELFYTGSSPNYEVKKRYDVFVKIHDSASASNLTSSILVTLAITDVNEAPTAITLSPTSLSIPENTTILATGYKVADIVISDDGIGSNTITPSGADAAFFAVRGTELWFIGPSPNFETKASYTVTLTVANSTIPANPNPSVNFTLTVTDVNEAPTSIFAPLSGAQNRDILSVWENAPGATVGTLSVNDPDAGDTFTLSVDDTRFEIVNNQLRLKAGVALDYEEVRPSILLTITATDRNDLRFNGQIIVQVLNQEEPPEKRQRAFESMSTKAQLLTHSFADDPLVWGQLLDPSLEPNTSEVYDFIELFSGVGLLKFERPDSVGDAAAPSFTLDFERQVVTINPASTPLDSDGFFTSEGLRTLARITCQAYGSYLAKMADNWSMLRTWRTPGGNDAMTAGQRFAGVLIQYF